MSMFTQAHVNPRRRLVCYGVIGRWGYSGQRAARLVRFACGDYAWETPTFKVWAELVHVVDFMRPRFGIDVRACNLETRQTVRLFV